jgi:hypothetical protein
MHNNFFAENGPYGYGFMLTKGSQAWLKEIEQKI